MRKTLHRYNDPDDAHYLTFSFREKSEKPDEDWDRYCDIQPSGKVHFRFWQRGGGYDRNIYSSQEVQEKLTYMHNNPVKCGRYATSSDSCWSSAFFYEGADSGPVPIETAVI